MHGRTEKKNKMKTKQTAAIYKCRCTHAHTHAPEEQEVLFAWEIHAALFHFASAKHDSSSLVILCLPLPSPRPLLLQNHVLESSNQLHRLIFPDPGTRVLVICPDPATRHAAVFHLILCSIFGMCSRMLRFESSRWRHLTLSDPARWLLAPVQFASYYAIWSTLHGRMSVSTTTNTFYVSLPETALISQNSDGSNALYSQDTCRQLHAHAHLHPAWTEGDNRGKE